MTRSISHSGERRVRRAEYESTVWRESRRWPGVRFEILRMSLLRRHRLMQELRTFALEEAFHRAGAEIGSEIAAAALQAEIDQRVIRTALLRIAGLSIDGAAATVDSLLENGPEDLAREIAESIADESSLSEDERKNSSSHSTSTGSLQPGGIARHAGRSGWRSKGIARGRERSLHRRGLSCGAAAGL